ncbi:MAG: cyclic nucleotide-binding domain-containing protein, partial [Gammaproteobacteria bacterium]|nr:cyclic nucleotide-binding domain-containing protein [Gammaproteobacteria bacterium]
IMKQGELSNGNTYLILSGNVDVLYHDGKQYERQAINQAGDLVGEMAIINQVKHRNASLVARTPVILGEIHGDLLFAFLSSEQRVDAIQEMFKKREILMRIFRNYGLSLIGAQRVAWAAKRIHPKKDAPFIPQGDTRDNFYIMLSGEYSVQKSGCEVTRLGARDMFGELGCFVDEIRSVSVKTLQDGDVLRLPKKEIASTIKSIPSLYFFARQQIKDKGGDFLGVSGQ